MSNQKCTTEEIAHLREELALAQDLEIRKMCDILKAPGKFVLMGYEMNNNKYGTVVLKIRIKNELFKVWAPKPLQQIVTQNKDMFDREPPKCIEIEYTEENDRFHYYIK